jgi:hypothetical protein
MEEAVKTVLDILGIHQVGSLGGIITVVFYFTLVVFFIFWLIETPVKLGRKILKRPHHELKVKKISRVAFKTTLAVKLFYFCLLLFFSLTRAFGVKGFWENYIQKPENLIYLLKKDKVFLVIFGMILFYELYFRVRRRA